MKNTLPNMEEILSHEICGFHQYVLTPPVHLNYVSCNLCELLGVDESELLDDSTDLYLKLVHPADREKYSDFFRTEVTHNQTLNDGALNGYNGVSAFTSSANVKVTEFMQTLGYGAKNGKIVTLDTGHFHLTESIADKVSALLLFTPEIMLHVSRPIRWDSDHVVIMNDDTLDLAKEIIRCDALDRVHIGLDYFDASINRIGAYVIGSRATQKCLLQALLEPLQQLREYEAEDKGFERLALLEEAKNLPWNAVWDMFCLRNGVPVGEEFIADIQQYEAEVTSKRV